MACLDYMYSTLHYIASYHITLHDSTYGIPLCNVMAGCGISWIGMDEMQRKGWGEMQWAITHGCITTASLA